MEEKIKRFDDPAFIPLQPYECEGELYGNGILHRKLMSLEEVKRGINSNYYIHYFEEGDFTSTKHFNITSRVNKLTWREKWGLIKILITKL